MRRFKVWIWIERTSISPHSTLFRETIGHLHILPSTPSLLPFQLLQNLCFKFLLGIERRSVTSRYYGSKISGRGCSNVG